MGLQFFFKASSTEDEVVMYLGPNNLQMLGEGKKYIQGKTSFLPTIQPGSGNRTLWFCNLL